MNFRERCLELEDSLSDAQDTIPQQAEACEEQRLERIEWGKVALALPVSLIPSDPTDPAAVAEAVRALAVARDVGRGMERDLREERDALRALAESDDGAGGEGMRLKLENDALRASILAAQDSEASALRHVEVLRAALKRVEFVHYVTGFDVECPWCHIGGRTNASDCPRQRALRGAP